MTLPGTALPPDQVDRSTARRRSRWRWRTTGLAVVAAVSAALAVVFGLGFGRNPEYVPSALIGRPSQALVGPTLTGARFTLRQDLGHPVLVNFWASWCVACRAEQPLLNQLAARYTRRGLRMVGVDMSDRPRAARTFLAGFGGARYPSVLDSDAQIAATWGVFGIPETYLVGPNGKILAKETGVIQPSWLRSQLLPRLGR